MIKINGFEIYQTCRIDADLGSMWFVDYDGIPFSNHFSLRSAIFSVINSLNKGLF